MFYHMTIIQKLINKTYMERNITLACCLTTKNEGNKTIFFVFISYTAGCLPSHFSCGVWGLVLAWACEANGRWYALPVFQLHLRCENRHSNTDLGLLATGVSICFPCSEKMGSKGTHSQGLGASDRRKKDAVRNSCVCLEVLGTFLSFHTHNSMR